jgi:hypothetical protein
MGEARSAQDYHPLVGRVDQSRSVLQAIQRNIGWDDWEESFPAFLSSVCIPLTYRISNGIGLGLIGHTPIKLLLGKARPGGRPDGRRQPGLSCRVHSAVTVAGLGSRTKTASQSVGVARPAIERSAVSRIAAIGNAAVLIKMDDYFTRVELPVRGRFDPVSAPV